MIKEYVLWLDESGDFTNEKQKKEDNKKPSLVGGMLLEKQTADAINLHEIIDSQRTHATEMMGTDKVQYVLPILEVFRDRYNGREIIFENANYATDNSSYDLYLNILAEGLLQLIQYLNALHESVGLKVVIAKRWDEGRRVNIADEEYLLYLKRRIESKKTQNRIFIDSKSSLSFILADARNDKRLQIADFVCNTRLTRDSSAFSDPAVRERVSALHDEALIFTLSEIAEDKYIQRLLTNGQIADAIMNAYTAEKILDEDVVKNIQEMILDRIKNTSYRILKSEMKKLSADITARVGQEDDYEVMEAFLLRLKENLIPLLKETEAPSDAMKFNLLLQLSDVFLREGDTDNARSTLAECEETQSNMGNALEEVFSYYQLLEKKAVLEIDDFNYPKAVEYMDVASKIFESVMGAVESSEVLTSRFPTLKSEYYGDVLCMKLYAMMFLQRERTDYYAEMARLSDIALKQYPDMEGELERHRQYRSHIELEEGNLKEALWWLAKAKEISLEQFTEDEITEFLETVARTEVTISCWYYLMYYCEIMAEAGREKNDLGKIMYSALVKAERIRSSCGISITNEASDSQKKVDLSPIAEEASEAKYHPTEIVFWKIADYCMYSNNKNVAASCFYHALRACYQPGRDYKTMEITGLGIRADYIAYLSSCVHNKGAAKMEGEGLVKKADELLGRRLEPFAKERIEKIRDYVQDAINDTNGINYEKLLSAGRLITY